MVLPVLERIFAARRAALKSALSQTSLSEMKARMRDAKPTRPFAAVLRYTGQISIIAEIKFRSPSAGDLRAQQPVADIARNYEIAGAKALSVLTEPEFFDGRLEYLRQAKDATSIPILRKDFIFDPYQIYESRAAGADAILLIAAMLERNEIADLAALSAEQELDVLVELHDESELEKIEGIAVPMLDVNHRNLKTMAIDLDVSRRLLSLLAQKAVLVAESGIETPEQLELMRQRGAHAALIGTSFMKSASPADALRSLRAV